MLRPVTGGCAGIQVQDAEMTPSPDAETKTLVREEEIQAEVDINNAHRLEMSNTTV